MGKWIVLLHVALAFAFVAGIVGRDLTLHKARTSTDVGLIGELMELAGRFEMLLIRPGSFAVLLAGSGPRSRAGCRSPLPGTDGSWSP